MDSSVVAEGVISPGDLDLFHTVDTADEAWAILAPALTRDSRT
ncbi:MAG: hypothetical protein RBT60_13050 [Candidatus Krumholzibacteria bacterium]|nr:hypothetical protein [Candidatus Krumholzibacteria bacterium]